MRPSTVVVPTLVLVAALSTAACSPNTRAERAHNELIAREFLATFESGDTTALYNLLGPTAVYDDFPDQQEFDGIQEIIGHVLSFETWGTNISMDIGKVYTGPNSAVAQWTLSLVQNRPIPHWVPMATNRTVTINGVTILQIEGGRITRAAEYWDTAPMVLQLGGKIVFPGGAVRQESEDTAGAGGGE